MNFLFNWAMLRGRFHILHKLWWISPWPMGLLCIKVVILLRWARMSGGRKNEFQWFLRFSSNVDSHARGFRFSCINRTTLIYKYIHIESLWCQCRTRRWAKVSKPKFETFVSRRKKTENKQAAPGRAAPGAPPGEANQLSKNKVSFRVENKRCCNPGEG